MAPFIDGRVGLTWFRNRFPGGTPSAAAMLKSFFCQPNLVARQFGFSQILPMSLYIGNTTFVGGKGGFPLKSIEFSWCSFVNNLSSFPPSNSNIPFTPQWSLTIGVRNTLKIVHLKKIFERDYQTPYLTCKRIRRINRVHINQLLFSYFTFLYPFDLIHVPFVGETGNRRRDKFEGPSNAPEVKKEEEL